MHSTSPADSLIHRSAGMLIPGGGIAGGGGYGITQALDDVVMHSAELLKQAYAMGVTIRFNSNRKSGGAWLDTLLGGHPYATDVGITAALIVVADHLKSMVSVFGADLGLVRHEEAMAGLGIDPATDTSVIRHYVYVSARALIDPQMAESGNLGSKYLHKVFASPEDALTFLLAHVKRPQGGDFI